MDDSLLSELVGQHHSLYDPKNKHYKDQYVKDNVWKEIADILDQSVHECKKRCKNIRDTYNRGKRTGKTGTGSARSAKACKWYLNDVLSSLSTVECERRSTSNVLDSSGIEGDQNTSEIGQTEQGIILQYSVEETLKEIEENSSDINEEERAPKIVNSLGTSANIQEERAPGSVYLQKQLKDRSFTNCSKRQKIIEKVFDLIKQNTVTRSERHARIMNAIETRNIEEHPIDTFFRSIAASVKQLSQSSQIKAKMEICRIVAELELKELQQTSADISVVSQPYSWPSSSFSLHSASSLEAPANTYEPQLCPYSLNSSSNLVNLN